MTNAYIASRIVLLTIAGAALGAITAALLVLAGPEPDPQLEEVTS